MPGSGSGPEPAGPRNGNVRPRGERAGAFPWGRVPARRTNHVDVAVSNIGTQLELHITSLRRYARALLRDKTQADDLVQESLARALSRADRFRAGTNLRAWLFTIMHNVHINQIRQKAVRPVEVAADGIEHSVATPAGQEHRMELRDMQRAISGLPEDQRKVLLLVALEGMKYEEVAEVLGIPLGTVMSRLSRAREAVRVRMSSRSGAALRRVK